MCDKCDISSISVDSREQLPKWRSGILPISSFESAVQIVFGQIWEIGDSFSRIRSPSARLPNMVADRSAWCRLPVNVQYGDDLSVALVWPLPINVLLPRSHWPGVAWQPPTSDRSMWLSILHRSCLDLTIWRIRNSICSPPVGLNLKRQFLFAGMVCSGYKQGHLIELPMWQNEDRNECKQWIFGKLSDDYLPLS